MKSFTFLEAEKNFSKIIDIINNREEIILTTQEDKEIIAVIVPFSKYKKTQERPLGILKGKASFEIKDDFKITTEEFLLS